MARALDRTSEDMLTTGVASHLTVRVLTRYFQTKTLTPFAIYCLVAGALGTVRFALG